MPAYLYESESLSLQYVPRSTADYQQRHVSWTGLFQGDEHVHLGRNYNGGGELNFFICLCDNAMSMQMYDTVQFVTCIFLVCQRFFLLFNAITLLSTTADTHPPECWKRIVDATIAERGDVPAAP